MTAYRLIDAAKAGNHQLVKLLVESGEDVTVKTSTNWTALQYACRRNDIDSVMLLLDSGVTYSDKYNSLTEASKKNHSEIIELFLNKLPDKNNLKIDSTLMKSIIMNIQTPVNISHIFDDKTTTYIDDKLVKTLVINASKNGNVKILDLLIKKGIDLNLKSETGDISLSLAISKYHTNVLNLLFENGAKLDNNNPALLSAVNFNNIAMVKLLLDNDANINMNDKDGNTCLMSAIKNRNIDMMQLLFENGISVHQTTLNGDNYLHLALNNISIDNAYKDQLLNQTEEIIKLLIIHGVDINKKDKRGNTPLMLAIIQLCMYNPKFDNIINIPKILIENGANINITDIHGQTALSIAISKQSVALTKLLLSAPGIAINGHLNFIPLIFASQIEDSIILKLLIDANANINIQNKDGMTPLIVACIKGVFENIKCLIDAGADLNLKDTRHNTVFDYAMDQRALGYFSSTNIRRETNDTKGNRANKIIKLLINAGCDIDPRHRKNLHVKYILQKKELRKLIDEVRIHKETIDNLNLQIKYMPGGLGMLEAQAEFEQHARNR